MFFKTSVIRNFAIVTGSICVGVSFNNLVPKGSSTQVILMKIAKVLRTAFLLNTSGVCFCQFDKVTVQ